jgi:hypothetical protein
MSNRLCFLGHKFLPETRSAKARLWRAEVGEVSSEPFHRPACVFVFSKRFIGWQSPSFATPKNLCPKVVESTLGGWFVREHCSASN